jgi:hypothetical protein
MPEQGQVLQSRVVRRRNPRPINSCVECRTRKSRCSKTHPCQNCTAFGRECIFITVPESAARKKEREQRERAASKSGANVTVPDWTRNIPVRTQSSTSLPDHDPYENPNSVNTTTPGTPPRDYDWQEYQQDVEVDRGDAWEQLPAEPEETQDDVYEDENDDEDQIATDLTIRIGRMIICENVTGFFRPQYAEEVLSILSALRLQDPSGVVAEMSRVAGQTPFGAQRLDLIRRWPKAVAVFCTIICRADAVPCAGSESAARRLYISA